MKSLRADTNLRSALTDNCANYRCPTGLADLEFSDQCFLDKFAITVRLIKSDEFKKASSFLDRARNTLLYWLHLFRAAVFSRMGNKDSARRSAHTAQLNFPDGVCIVDSLIGGFFPYPEPSSLFREGLGRAF